MQLPFPYRLPRDSGIVDKNSVRSKRSFATPPQMLSCQVEAALERPVPSGGKIAPIGRNLLAGRSEIGRIISAACRITGSATEAEGRLAFFIHPNQCLLFFRDPEAAFTPERMKQVLADEGVTAEGEAQPFALQWSGGRSCMP